MDLSSIGGPSNGVVVGGDRAGARAPERARALRVAQPRPRRGRRVPRGRQHDAAYDYFHVNSIELDADGNLLVSARNTWAIYKIDRGSGNIIWRLGGKKSDFAMGPGTGFAWQHDARHHGASDQLVSLFDDGAAPQVQPQSKALVLALDTKRMRATLHRKYTHGPPLLSHALGSTQLLPNGNVLVGWGTAPWLSEYTRGGALVFDAHLPHGGQNYRVLKFPWHGRPTEPPRSPRAAAPVTASSTRAGTAPPTCTRGARDRPDRLVAADGDVRPAGRASRPSSRRRPTRGMPRSSPSTPTASRSAARRP